MGLETEWIQELARQNTLLRGLLVDILHCSADPVVRCLAMKTIAELKDAGVCAGDLDAILAELKP